MRFKIIEAYHFGDLDYARKADQKNIIVGQKRGTGHFGTGFYVVSFYDENKTPIKYWDRGHWEIDLDKYNLYKPRTNSQAYQLHDTLALLDDLNFDSLKNYSAFDLQDELWDYENDYGNDGILKFIKKYVPQILNDYDFNQDLKDERWGAVEDYAKAYINDIEKSNDELATIKRKLARIFNLREDDIEDIIKDVIKDNSSNDSLATRFMKSLGFEGVDVSHLNKDDDGLAGLDNFSYGSVIYDLKPGTYRKIK